MRNCYLSIARVAKDRGMNRRAVIGSSALALSAGCIGSVMEDEKEYEPSEESSMYPGIDAFPSDWKRDDDYNEHFDRVFLAEDESVVVMMDVEVADSIEASEERFAYAKDRADYHEFSLADEAYWVEEADHSAAVFRHSNAFGQTFASNLSGTEWRPDTPRATHYALVLFGAW